MKPLHNPSIRKKLGRIDSRFFYRLFYPQVPVIICAKMGAEVAAMPANSCIPVSDKPAILALAVRRGSRTANVISSSGKFTLNWLNYRSKRARNYVIALSKPFEFYGEHRYDKLSSNKVPYLIDNGQPFLIEAEGNALCKTLRRLDCGDHYLFLGRVVRCSASADFLSIKYWQFRKYKPILYTGSALPFPLTTIRDRR